MVVSLKANKKRIVAFLVLAAVVVGACFFLWNGKEVKPAEIRGGTEEERVAYLQSFGWQVDPQAVETREVMIPAEFNDVYTAYNVMQQAQGFDLKPYAGAVCTQYKYQVLNYPDEQEVYATLLVYGELIVGGDVACAEVDGFMHGFAPDSARYGEQPGNQKSAGEQENQASSQAPADNQAPANSAAETGAVESGAGKETSLAEESSAAESTAGEIVSEDLFPTD